jgi:hypothetical protein
MHPATRAILRWFDPDDLPDDLQWVAAPIQALACRYAHELPQDPEVTVGLRKLLEAREAFLRAAVSDRGTNE